MNETLLAAIRRYDASPEKAYADTGAAKATSGYFVAADGVVRPCNIIGMLMSGATWSEHNTAEHEEAHRAAGCVILRSDRPIEPDVLETGAAQARAFRTGKGSDLRKAAIATAIAFDGKDGDHNERLERIAMGGLRLGLSWLALNPDGERSSR